MIFVSYFVVLSATGSNPVIIINLWTFTHQLKHSVKDVVFGYRLNKIEKKFEDFLLKLQTAGAEMIFVFKKASSKSNFFTEKQVEYESARTFIDTMRTSSSVLDVEFKLRMNLRQTSRSEFPFNHAVMIVLSQVAQRYGNLRGMDTINNQPSTFQVHLANKYQAMALLGLDTHYIFYGGDWAFWSDADLDMDRMTILQYDKRQIMRHMGLTAEKAPLFVALAGSLHSSEANVKRVVNHFRPWTKQLFPNVAAFVNEQTFPLTDSNLAGIVTEIFGRCPSDIFEDFKQTMLLMNPVENLKISGKVGANIMELIKDDFANLAEEILENSPIFISPVYLDLR